MNWKRSSFCDAGQCAWVSIGARTTWLADSAGTVLVADHHTYRQLIDYVKETGDAA